MDMGDAVANVDTQRGKKMAERVGSACLLVAHKV